MSQLKHILVVEDERHLAIGIKFNLEAERYRVTTVDNGPAALEVFQKGEVDLAILDIMLPGMSGYEICESLRAAGNDVPVLFLSARTLAEDRARGFDVGADQYMNKPFDLAELLSRIRNLLALHDRRNASRAARRRRRKRLKRSRLATPRSTLKHSRSIFAGKRFA
ncbi:response regulator transcription factor [Lignipirellula cremea]|uniref:response regulator transcription factor n=1 Tax=Lignipirellula cremea TaxID=2528010 RepID=UPI001E5FF91F|nr:response regulator [Lignipirellula cremea]